MHVSRRSFLKCGLTNLCAVAVAAPGVASAENVLLKDAGLAKGIDVGSAVRSRVSQEVAKVVAQECSLVVPENALKPANLSRGPGDYRWSDADRTYEFAKANGLRVHGHALFWHKQPLKWAQQQLDGRGLQYAIETYGDFARAVISRYPNTVSWDVLNEIAGTRSMLRNAHPMSEFGVDLFASLLHNARSIAPRAALVINEDNLESGTSESRAKRKNVLKLLKSLKERGAPLNALGVQGHLNSARLPDPEATLDFFGDVQSLGLDIYLSELDVRDSAFDSDFRRRDDQIAELYWKFLSTTLKSRAVKRVVFWGITDAENWLTNGTSQQKRRPRPALFDRYMGRKPAYYAVREALARAPGR